MLLRASKRRTVTAPSTAYAGSPFAWVQNVAIASPGLPTESGLDPVTSYAIQAGSLSAGLALNLATGAISGTPTALNAVGSVTVRARNRAGYSDAVVAYVVATV